MSDNITESVNTSAGICIVDSQLSEQATQLATQLSIDLYTELPSVQPLWLQWITDKKSQESRLSLCSAKSGPVNIDFLGGKKAHRQRFGGGKNQPLVRAMGSLESSSPTILDATAGMGGDSFVLATQGFKVLMVERSPIVAALLEDALQRAYDYAVSTETDKTHAPLSSHAETSSYESMNNLKLVNADSAQYLINETPDIDVVYMDPMYPEKKKKAAAKKEMQALQQLVGPDLDSTILLDAALKTANYRVVVKRPKGAPPLQSMINNIQPSTSISSPNTRYDIYAIKALKSSGHLVK